MHEELVAWLGSIPPLDSSVLRGLLTTVVKATPRIKHRALGPVLLAGLHVLAAQSTSQARVVLLLLHEPMKQRCQLHLTGDPEQRWELELSALADWLRLAETKVGEGTWIAPAPAEPTRVGRCNQRRSVLAGCSLGANDDSVLTR
jgi:hypothetical protein